jgi:ParB/Sulfiredoxin domain
MNVSTTVQHIEHWSIDRLIPFVGNARSHSSDQISQICASIAEFGFVNPILVDTDGLIIAGHARVMAAKKLMRSQVTVIVLGHLSAIQRRALVIADNQLALNAGWDEAKLRAELAALEGEDFQVDLIGLDKKELLRRKSGGVVTGLTDEDALPAVAQMEDSKLPRMIGKEIMQPETEGSGEAAAAAKNRQRETRSRIVDAYGRLGNPLPDYVRAFRTNPQTQYSYGISPPPFQAPEFDPLNQSREDWVQEADEAWKKHQKAFWEDCDHWVAQGLDEEIKTTVRPRGPGKRRPTKAGSWKRKENTPMDKRYEWVAKYLAGEPLKVIAGPNEDVSVVGRVVREILRVAGWSRKPAGNAPKR